MKLPRNGADPNVIPPIEHGATYEGPNEERVQIVATTDGWGGTRTIELRRVDPATGFFLGPAFIAVPRYLKGWRKMNADGARDMAEKHGFRWIDQEHDRNGPVEPKPAAAATTSLEDILREMTS